MSLLKTDINNYKNYSYFYKSLNKLVLYKGNFTIFPSLFEIVILKLSFKILVVDKIISIIKSYKVKRIKTNLASKSRIFSNNSKYFKYILEVVY
ncbi:hypothetical protein C8035_v011219 [Colletotrichum spinosum]|uniref:Uncharacterized protein n=1 Tax=Colletotrichum spinosum TaxID=1347390 RepID=A0A4R8PSD5_9PEZI|nr:hypothetical protein C8035_v011219 [Colletotrichum spinosum]